MQEHFKENNLVLNMQNTHAMVLKSKINKIGEHPFILETTNDTKFLRLILNNKLDWSSHVEYLRKKLSPIAYLVKKVAQTCSLNKAAYILRLLESVARYGIIFWGNSTKPKQRK